MSRRLSTIEDELERAELEYMLSANCDFLTERQLEQLNVLLTVNLRALDTVTEGMTNRDKNIVCNMFIANLNNATVIKN